MITGKLQLCLTGLQLRFLQAEEVSIQVLKHLGEVLPHHGPQAVHIPRNQFHIAIIALTNFASNPIIILNNVSNETEMGKTFEQIPESGSL